MRVVLLIFACLFMVAMARLNSKYGKMEGLAGKLKFRGGRKHVKNVEVAVEAESDSMGSLSTSQLRSIMTGLSESNANKYIGALNTAMASAGINTCARQSAFIAQLAHESGQLRYWEELASGAAYEGRKDLGNTQPGDGKRFKGRGPIQLTGRVNYAAAGRALGMDLVSNPTIVATTDVGFKTTCWFWNSKSLSTYADQNSQSAFDTITKRINGGTNGKADRDQFWRRAKSVLGC